MAHGVGLFVSPPRDQWPPVAAIDAGPAHPCLDRSHPCHGRSPLPPEQRLLLDVIHKCGITAKVDVVCESIDRIYRPRAYVVR